jgi:hypothetical protein
MCHICVNSDSVESYISRNAERKYACQKNAKHSYPPPPGPGRSERVGGLVVGGGVGCVKGGKGGGCVRVGGEKC